MTHIQVFRYRIRPGNPAFRHVRGGHVVLALLPEQNKKAARFEAALFSRTVHWELELLTFAL